MMSTLEPRPEEPTEPDGDEPEPADPDPESGPAAATGPTAVSRFRLGVVVVIAVATVALGLVGGYRLSGDTAPSATPSPEATTKKLPEADSSEAPEDGGIEIVEQGFRPITDVAGEPQVTWGAIVENTSKRKAATVQLKLRILDAEGDSLNEEHGDYALDPSVPSVLPKQRTGIGDAVYVDKTGVDKVEIAVESVTWYPPEQFAELKVSDIEGEWVGKGEEVPYWGDSVGSYVNERGRLVLRFRVDSAYDRLLDRPGASAIFRLDGKIVGGAPVDSIGSRAEYPPGWSKQWLKVKYGPPEKFDEKKTEVYAYAGPGY